MNDLHFEILKRIDAMLNRIPIAHSTCPPHDYAAVHVHTTVWRQHCRKCGDTRPL